MEVVPKSLSSSRPIISTSYSAWLLLILNRKRMDCSTSNSFGPSKTTPALPSILSVDSSTKSFQGYKGYSLCRGKSIAKSAKCYPCTDPHDSNAIWTQTTAPTNILSSPPDLACAISESKVLIIMRLRQGLQQSSQLSYTLSPRLAKFYWWNRKVWTLGFRAPESHWLSPLTLLGTIVNHA